MKSLWLLALTVSIGSAESLHISNPLFSNVPVLCAVGYAYQAAPGNNCNTVSPGPDQAFNGSPGIGWAFSPNYDGRHGGIGLTRANTGFYPPPFTGFPFSQAALLQGRGGEVVQTVYGLEAGMRYRLSFYLGSRYATGSFDGNQTVAVLIDDRPIGSWSLVSYTPFTLQTAPFDVSADGPHVVRFIGTAHGDHTAFFSGVSIKSLYTTDEK